MEKTNAMRILEKNRISYRLHTYDVTDGVIDGVSVAKKVGAAPQYVYKTLVTRGKSNNYFVFVIPVENELDLKAAAKSVREKSVEMIVVKDINRITGYIRGGCSPVGMKKQFVTVIDETAAKFDFFLVSGGKIGIQIELAPMELVALIGAKFAPVIM